MSTALGGSSIAETKKTTTSGNKTTATSSGSHTSGNFGSSYTPEANRARGGVEVGATQKSTSYPTSGQGVVLPAGNANGTFAGGSGGSGASGNHTSGSFGSAYTPEPDRARGGVEVGNPGKGTATVTIPGGTALGGGGSQTVTYPRNTSVPAKNQGTVTTGDANGTFAGGSGSGAAAAKPAGLNDTQDPATSGHSHHGGSWAETDGGGTQTATDANGNPGSGNPGSGNPGGGSTGGGSNGGGGTGGGGSGGGGSTGYTDAQLLAQALSNAGVNMTPYQLPNMQGPNPDWLDHVSTDELRGMLEQLVESQKQQSQNQIDYGVQQGVNELTRAMEDAAPQFQTQRNQISADEARALDNQALYAEARGDRGGIGQAQYNSIQNTAAQNRRAVNDAQVKLSTDTARQIADLRARGEFQKADQLLSITQNYLSQLMSLEQWALETNLSVDQFNSRLQQWVDEYNLNVQKYLTDLDLSAAQLTGVFANGQKTLAGQNLLRESLANSGSALLAAGVLPSRQQLQAMGMTEVQAKAYLNKTGK